MAARDRALGMVMAARAVLSGFDSPGVAAGDATGDAPEAPVRPPRSARPVARVLPPSKMAQIAVALGAPVVVVDEDGQVCRGKLERRRGKVVWSDDPEADERHAAECKARAEG